MKYINRICYVEAQIRGQATTIRNQQEAICHMETKAKAHNHTTSWLCVIGIS